MSVRVRYSVQSAISSTPAEERDLGNVYWQIVTDQKTKGGTTKTVVAAGATNLQIQIDNLSTIQFLAIRTVADNANYPPNGLTFNLNSTSGPAIFVQPLGDAQEGHLMMSTDSVTALYVTNAGPSDMAISISFAGV